MFWHKASNVYSVCKHRHTREAGLYFRRQFLPPPTLPLCSTLIQEVHQPCILLQEFSTFIDSKWGPRRCYIWIRSYLQGNDDTQCGWHISKELSPNAQSSSLWPESSFLYWYSSAPVDVPTVEDSVHSRWRVKFTLLLTSEGKFRKDIYGFCSPCF